MAETTVAAAHRKGHSTADDRDRHGRHLEGRLGAGLGESWKRVACKRSKSEGGGSLENRSAIHKSLFLLKYLNVRIVRQVTGWRRCTIPDMLNHPHINPVALQIGPMAIHWYGLTYLAAFGLFMALAIRRLHHLPYAGLEGPTAWRRVDVEDILFLGVLGVVLGGRLGYCLFYKPMYYLSHPLDIVAVWQGGMSFHGGMLGVVVAMLWFARTRERPFWQVADFVAPCVPTGLAAGRVGNFINGELPGRLSDPDLPWGMVFRGAGELPRHPSQAYQFLLEGLLLFALLWLYARKPRATGQVAAAFLVGYGVLRFTAEFFREPDAHLGLLALGMSMGQWLCVPMVIGGATLWWWFGGRGASGSDR